MLNNMDEFKELVNIIEKEQAIKAIIRKSNNSDNITILPFKQSKKESDDESFLQITFRINQETFILSWLYLLEQGKGTGTKIVDWIIKYCKLKNLEQVRIVNIKKDKLAMRELCVRFGFVELKDNNEFSDYYLKI